MYCNNAVSNNATRNEGNWRSFLGVQHTEKKIRLTKNINSIITFKKKKRKLKYKSKFKLNKKEKNDASSIDYEAVFNIFRVI